MVSLKGDKKKTGLSNETANIKTNSQWRIYLMEYLHLWRLGRNLGKDWSKSLIFSVLCAEVRNLQLINFI